MYSNEQSEDWAANSAEELARRVRLSVDRSRMHGLRLIDIEVIGDTVVLSGQVVTFHQKQLATAFARRVAGVVEVVNRLEVHNGRNDDDQQRPGNVGWQRRAVEAIDRRTS